MTAPLTKNDIEDALRRVLDAHTRSPWLDTEAAAIYLSSTPGTLRSWRANGEGLYFQDCLGFPLSRRKCPFSEFS